VRLLGVLLSQKSDHELVPVHEIMTEGDVKSLMKELGIVPENLPKIYTTDPQAVKIGAKSGQILKISRKEGAISYPYYRIVVEG
jgi:DNA-directed RNA polymerase subunit H